MTTVIESSGTGSPANGPIKLLYDSACPLCMREVRFLQQRDAGRGIVAFVDIAALDYNPEDNGGIDFGTAMGRIHAILPDGTTIQNVDVFRRIYEALGIGWVYAATKWPIVGPVVDWIYELWAQWRLAMTGRPKLEMVIAERDAAVAASRCRLTDQESCAR